MTLLHFSFKLLEILLYYLKILQSHSRGGLFMAARTDSESKGRHVQLVSPSDITRVRIDHFLKPVTDKGQGMHKSLFLVTCVKYTRIFLRLVKKSKARVLSLIEKSCPYYARMLNQ